jgi:integrase/recombinase XerC
MNPVPVRNRSARTLLFMATLTPLIGEYLRARVARGEISRQTAVDFAYPLAALARSHGARPLHRFGPAAIDRWLETIGHQAPATRRHRLSIIRGFCHWLVTTRRIPRDPTTHVAQITQPRRVPVTLNEREVSRIIWSVPDARARAIAWLMVGCGCRCIEVARLDVADYDPDNLTITLVGKGGHQRIIPVPSTVSTALTAYLEEVGRVAGPLIRSEVDHRSPLSARTISGYMRRWMRDAGVKVRPLDGRSAHCLRRTAGSDVMDRAGDVRVVQEMLGHVRVETTARYYLRPIPLDRLRDAMEGRTYTMYEDAA